MTNNAIADYRKKTFALIEKLDDLVGNLSIIAETDSEIGGPVGGYYEKSLGEACVEWPILFKLTPGDHDNQLFLAALDEIYNLINSKEAARAYPRGVYRELIEFSDRCIERKKWAKFNGGTITIPESKASEQEEIQKEATASVLPEHINRFRSDIKTVRRAILFFENERDESEESFLEE